MLLKVTVLLSLAIYLALQGLWAFAALSVLALIPTLGLLVAIGLAIALLATANYVPAAIVGSLVGWNLLGNRILTKLREGGSVSSDKLLELEHAVSLMQVALYTQLWQRYHAESDEETAKKLAAAVTNALFSNPSTDPLAQAFVISHGSVIGRKLGELQKDRQICEVVTETLRICLHLECLRMGRVVEPRLYRPLQRLAELGLLVSGGDGPDPRAFPGYANSYFRSYVGTEPPDRHSVLALKHRYSEARVKV